MWLFALLLVLVWPTVVMGVCFLRKFVMWLLPGQFGPLYFWLNYSWLGFGQYHLGSYSQGWVLWFVATFCCISFGFGEVKGHASCCNAPLLYSDLYCSLYFSSWFYNLLLCMYDLWSLLPFFLSHTLSVSFSSYLDYMHFSSIFIWLQLGMWQIFGMRQSSAMRLFLCCMVGAVFGLLMVRGHKGCPLWPMASPWNSLSGVFEFNSVWPMSELCQSWPCAPECLIFAYLWSPVCCLCFVIVLVILWFGIVQFLCFGSWVWYGVLLHLVCCWSAVWKAWALGFLWMTVTKILELRHSHVSLLFATIHDEVFAYFMSLFFWPVYSLFGVWKLVGQLTCSARCFPGSVQGSCLSLDCCWKGLGPGFSLFVLWLCVASSSELWQPLAPVFSGSAHDEAVYAPNQPEVFFWLLSVHWVFRRGVFSLFLQLLPSLLHLFGVWMRSLIFAIVAPLQGCWSLYCYSCVGCSLAYYASSFYCCPLGLSFLNFTGLHSLEQRLWALYLVDFPEPLSCKHSVRFWHHPRMMVPAVKDSLFWLLGLLLMLCLSLVGWCNGCLLLCGLYSLFSKDCIRLISWAIVMFVCCLYFPVICIYVFYGTFNMDLAVIFLVTFFLGFFGHATHRFGWSSSWGSCCDRTFSLAMSLTGGSLAFSRFVLLSNPYGLLVIFLGLFSLRFCR